MENEVGDMRQGDVVIQGKGILHVYGNHGIHMSEMFGSTEYLYQKDVWEPRNTCHIDV